MGKKIRASFLIPDALLEQIRDAVVALQGPPYRMTMAKFAELALSSYLQQLQAAENQGRPFPPHKGEIKIGRPVGS